MSFRRYSSVASTAPLWMIAVNAVTSGSSILKPISFSRMVRCPVEEIGRNSVSPSTRPSSTASHRSICSDMTGGTLAGA